MPSHEPTIASILLALSTQYDGPVTERQVLDRVLEQRPSSAKNPYATIRDRLRWDGLALGWVRLDRNELVPLRIVLKGLRFRCIPEDWEIGAGILPMVRLQPFVGLRNPSPLLQEGPGASFNLLSSVPEQQAHGDDLDMYLPAFDLRHWYRRKRFTAGDSLLVTVVATEPLTLQIAYEAAADFRTEAVLAQDSELVEAVVRQVERSHLPLIPCDELILPVFARALWRTSYPGRPWQQLLTYETRLHLVDDIFVANRQSRVLFLSSDQERPEQRQAEEADLLAEIEALQQEIRRSRQQDADAGLWTGPIERSSTAYTFLDRRGREFAFSNDVLDNLHDYGDGLDDLDEDELLFEGWEDDDLLDTPFGPDFDEFDDLYPDLIEARQRLFAALPPDTVERLQQATSDEAEVLIAAHLNDLLVHEPSLFVKIDLSPLGSNTDTLNDTDSIGPPSFEAGWSDDTLDWGEMLDDDWDDDLEAEASVTSNIYARSSDMMSQFHDHLIATGKSASTARWRTRNLWVYAEFLVSHYGRTLLEGDYATLDEFLFYYYPRKVTNTSPRQAREICTSLKQFYAFLRQRGDIADERFAEALWRRREQIARVVELYNRISNDYTNPALLVARLFDPYSH